MTMRDESSTDGPAPSLDELRRILAEAAARTSPRAVAREAGVHPQSVQNFIDGGKPTWATRRKIRSWISQADPVTPEELSRWKEELAELARRTARLLTTPRYDEAALAELDVRARELRARIRAAEGPRRKEDDDSLIPRGGRLTSGG